MQFIIDGLETLLSSENGTALLVLIVLALIYIAFKAGQSANSFLKVLNDTIKHLSDIRKKELGISEDLIKIVDRLTQDIDISKSRRGDKSTSHNRNETKNKRSRSKKSKKRRTIRTSSPKHKDGSSHR